ncbi:MAG: DUF1475 family protein [Stenotrophobium sp.]
MKQFLLLFSCVVIAALAAVSVWATGHIGVVLAIRELAAQPGAGINPWFIATLFDAFFGFLWFWLWLAYKETSWAARIVWLLLILLGGNMTMAVYVLIQLWRLPAGATVQDLLLRRV